MKQILQWADVDVHERMDSLIGVNGDSPARQIERRISDAPYIWELKREMRGLWKIKT